VWSAPAVLSNCAADAAPQIAFPSNKPSHATGPGAIVWSASASCSGGEGARVARIGAGDVPAASRAPRTLAGRQISPRGALTISGAPHGHIVIAGASPRGRTGGLLIEGTAGGPFAPLASGAAAAAPVALTTAYLGDVALAAGDSHAGALRVQVQRHFAASFDRSAPVSAGGPGSARALSVAMDFRSDALAVWEQGGAIYAHDLPVSGTKHPIQRIARVSGVTRIAALLSDDNRGILAWAEQHGDSTSVYLDQSATGVSFPRPRLLERFSDPDGLASPSGSPRLVRLSSESVMAAWAGAAGGHWVVRTAAIDQRGLQHVSTIAAAGADDLLADLAPGPLNEALVLWSEATAGGGAQTLFSARGGDLEPGRTVFGEPERLATAMPGSDPLVAFDPSSDRAVAVWRGAGTTIDYAIRSDIPGH
jgi:hypothetical protein